MTKPLAADGSDTALARQLWTSGVLSVSVLRACLQEVRRQRELGASSSGAPPSLRGLLLQARLVSPAVLERATDSLQLAGHAGESSFQSALEGQQEAASATPAAVPTDLGPYRFVRTLASGGMGAVHEVRHDELGAHYALKTLLVGVPGDSRDEDLERFRREAELMARLQHPHVARVHAARLDGTTPYFVQDLLSGGSLRERLRLGPLPPEEACGIAIKLARGLQHAHEEGVLHRDLKPDNVMFNAAGEPVLVDFGLALAAEELERLTQSGAVLGTPAYMAPEQASGDRAAVGEAADVYGLGAVLYAMLTGGAPFSGGTLYAVLANVLSEAPVPPSELVAVPPSVEACCLRALAKNPAERFASAAALGDALEGALRDEGQGLPRRGGAFRLAALAAGALALAGGGLAWAWRERGTLPPASPTAGENELDFTSWEGLLVGAAGADADQAFRERYAEAIRGARALPPSGPAQRLGRRFAAVLDSLVEDEFRRAFGSKGDVRGPAEAIRARARAFGLSDEVVRRAKRRAWERQGSKWRDLVEAQAVEGSAQQAALNVERLAGGLLAAPALPDAVAPLTSRAFARLLAGEPGEVPHPSLERAVVLQLARRRFELPPPYRLRLAMEAFGWRGSRLWHLQIGIPLGKEYSGSQRRSQATRDDALALPLKSQTRAFVELDEYNEQWPAQRLEAYQRQVQAVLDKPDKDLGLRYVAEALLLQARARRAQFALQGGGDSEAESSAHLARRARRLLHRTPGDLLLVSAWREELLAWSRIADKSRGLRESLAALSESERCLRDYLASEQERVKIEAPEKALSTLLREKAECFYQLREFARGIALAREALVWGAAFERSLREREFSSTASSLRLKHDLESARILLAGYKAKGDLEGGLREIEPYLSEESAGLHPHFVSEAAEGFLEVGDLKKAERELGRLGGVLDEASLTPLRTRLRALKAQRAAAAPPRPKPPR